MSQDIIASDWIAYHARFSPHREAIRDLASGRRYTYLQFDERITKVALYFNSFGINKGDRVAVLAYNDSDLFEIQFACQRVGAIFLPLNWRLTVPELEYICNDASPKLLMYGEAFSHEAADVAKRCGITRIANLASGGPSDYESGIDAASGSLETPVLDITDVWTIMYTSGTTGRPKGAQMTYRMALFNAIHCASSVALTVDSKNLVFLPTFHTAGLNVYANPIFHTGGTNVVLRTFDITHFLELLSDKELHITHALGVPTNFLMMAQEPGFASADLSHIVSLGVGGAAAPLSLIQDYGEKGIKLQQTWGMTEAGSIGLILSGEMALEKVGSSGLPPMHTDLKICDKDGNEIDPGETGELMIKGPTVTPGYWNRAKENPEFFTEDGWFHTGDVAKTDEDGYYYIVDRWKDMFISGGENVYPAEVENVIFELDGVLENAVVGIPHEKWGEVGRAFVVLKPGANLDEGAIVRHCEDNLARFKVPKEVKLIDELPYNASGKVSKHLLPKD